MERLDYVQFVAARAEFDAMVTRSGESLAGGPLSSCSLSPWLLSAHGAMGVEPGDGEPEGGEPAGGEPAGDAGRPDGRGHLIYRSAHAWLVLVEHSTPGVYVPFESAWMFACPLVGEPLAALDLLARVAAEHRHSLRAILLGGLPRDGELHRMLSGAASQGGYAEEEGTESCIIDLREGGVEGWLARRTRNFRRSALRASLPAGVELIDGQGVAPEEAFQRILRIQERSYKARDGEDLFTMPMYRNFYRALMSDLHGSGELRLSFAVRGGEDLAYHFGFTRGVHYRGYQMSFVEEARPLGLGTALQMLHLRRAEEEGATRYDMGMLAPYKERWCDRIDRTVIAILQ